MTHYGDPAPHEEELPIWQSATLFPEKPAHIPYGYLPFHGQAVGAHTLAELKEAYSAEKDQIYAVWVPEQERVIPVAEVPELLDVLKPKRIQEAHAELKKKRLSLILTSAALLFFTIPAIQEAGWKFYTYQGVGMVGILFAIYGLQPYYQAWKSQQSAHRLSLETLGEEAREMRFELWISGQRAPFTKALTFLLIGLTLLQILAGGESGNAFGRAADLAGLRHRSLLHGETWRLWTAPFLHGGWIHLFFNASALWYLGKRVEVLAKWAHFLMVFISSALFGSFCSMHFLPIGREGIGASGGIMGLLGFLLAFELLHPKLAPKPARRRLIGAIMMMFVIGFIGVSFIDNAAHAGGLVAGTAYAYLAFSRSSSAKRPELQPLDWLIGIGSLLLISWSVTLTYIKIS